MGGMKKKGYAKGKKVTQDGIDSAARAYGMARGGKPAKMV